MRIGFLRTCFGCCSLRTGVLLAAIIDLIIGTSEIIEFCVRVYLDFNHDSTSDVEVYKNSTSSSSSTGVLYGSVAGTVNATSRNTTVSVFRAHSALYDDSAFAVIVVCCIDVFISSFLLYVTALRKYDLRVVIFIAAIWCFVDAFLNMVQFAVFVALNLLLDMVEFLISALLQVLFGYVILSYFKFMTVVVERGLDDIHMSYFPEDRATDMSEVQMEEANNERPIMDDEEDYNDDDEQKLVVI